MPVQQKLRSIEWSSSEWPAPLHTADVAQQIEHYGPILLRYCQKLTRSPWDAEDLAQDTLLKAWPKLTHPHDNLQAFLFRIAKNAWIDKCRKRKHARECTFESELAEADENVDRTAVVDAMSQLLQHLSPLQRVVILLRDVFGFTAIETAGLIGTTQGAVKSTLHRARKTLEAVRADRSEEKRSDEADANLLKGMLNAYLEAFWNSDMEALVLLAKHDVIHPVHALITLWSNERTPANRQAQLGRSPLPTARYAPFASSAYWKAA